MDFTVRIGLVPVRRTMPGKRKIPIFGPTYAIENKQRLVPHIVNTFGDDRVRFVDLDFLNEEGMLFQESDVDAVVDRFTAEKVDALFIVNCNFGNEEAAGLLARRMGKPVLIWAPQDEVIEADGMRYTDSQCGLFALSKYLQRANVPFSWIRNCRVEVPAFAEGVRRFIAVACMVKNFTGMRIAQVGTRPKPFTSVIVDEGALFSRFGIQVIPVNIGSVIDRHRRIMEERDADLDRDVREFSGRFDTGDTDNLQLKRMLAFTYLYREIMEEFNCDVIATECWTAMPQAVGAFPCCAMSKLADERVIVTCETDILGSITMALLASATLGRSVPFFIELTVRHPERENVELLWHCGPVAYSLKKEDSRAHLDMTRCGFELKPGTYTMARLDSDHGAYSLLSGTFRTTTGPYTFGNYLWAEFDDLDAVERKIIEGPYIHHMAEIEGDHVETIREFSRYVPGIAHDPLPGAGRGAQ